MTTLETMYAAKGAGLLIGLVVMAVVVLYRLGVRETVKSVVYLVRESIR